MGFSNNILQIYDPVIFYCTNIFTAPYRTHRTPPTTPPELRVL